MQSRQVILVLIDGECRFCQASLLWVSKELEVKAIPYQGADLSHYGLSYEECSQAVHVICGGNTYVGANAIAYLLGRRRNWILGFILRASGPLGRFGYHWVATHRNSALIKAFTILLERAAR